MSIDDKRLQIIQAAISQFIKTGFAAASISDITARAGIAKGTLYLYFPSKEDLIKAVFLHCHEMNVAACDVGLEAIPTAIGKLCHRMKNAVRWAIEHPMEAQVDSMYLSYPKQKEYGTHYWEQKHVHSVEPIILKGIADGELKAMDPMLLGEVFFGVAGAYYHYVKQKPELLENPKTWALCEQTVIDCLSR